MTHYKGCIKITRTKRISFLPRSVYREGYYRGTLLWTPELYVGGGHAIFRDAHLSDQSRCATRIYGIATSGQENLCVIPEWEYTLLLRDGIPVIKDVFIISQALVDNRWLFESNIMSFHTGTGIILGLEGEWGEK